MNGQQYELTTSSYVSVKKLKVGKQLNAASQATIKKDHVTCGTN